MDDATRVDKAAILDVVKNRDPSLSGARLNFVSKKWVTQDLKHIRDIRIFVGY
jgi:hypothetical protein